MIVERSITTVACVLAVSAAICGCGREKSPSSTVGSGKVTGGISADGSSTVGPLMTAAAERFRATNPDIKIVVGISGTGGGFQRFCSGETDLSDASRPIEADEIAACKKHNVDYKVFQIANDGIAVVVNKANSWTKCLSIGQLAAIWRPKSPIQNWRAIDPSYPAEELELFGPGADSGTFDFFTEKVVGKEDSSRSDYQATEDDNVIVEGVGGTKGGLGYFGLSYAEENLNKVRPIAVKSDRGCVTPSTRSVQNGSYVPLSRPLFVYANTKSLARDGVKQFLRFLLDNHAALAKQSRFVPMTPKETARSKHTFDSIG